MPRIDYCGLGELYYTPFFRQDWIVYVDQSKASLERGGVATLDAFMGIAPTNSVSVMAAILPKPPKGKGPYVRCVPLKRQTKFSAFEVSNVNSVEKVYRILTKHMGLSVSPFY